MDRGGQLFRKKFTIEKDVKSARAYISGLGYYEMYKTVKKSATICWI